MFPSLTPRKKKRGRQPPAYGPVRCVLCYRKPKVNLQTRIYSCECGWRHEG